MRAALFIIALIIFFGATTQVQPTFLMSKSSFIEQFDATEREKGIISAVYDSQGRITGIANVTGLIVLGLFAVSLPYGRKPKENQKSNHTIKADEK